MADRMALQRKLKALFGPSVRVYYQEPQNPKMQYPCIRYERSTPSVKQADNRNYTFTQHYTLYCISPDPENDLQEKILKEFPMSSPGSNYKADDLYHAVVSLFW